MVVYIAPKNTVCHKKIHYLTQIWQNKFKMLSKLTVLFSFLTEVNYLNLGKFFILFDGRLLLLLLFAGYGMRAALQQRCLLSGTEVPVLSCFKAIRSL